jgi:hypothetical protein
MVCGHRRGKKTLVSFRSQKLGGLAQVGPRSAGDPPPIPGTLAKAAKGKAARDYHFIIAGSEVTPVRAMADAKG